MENCFGHLAGQANNTRIRKWKIYRARFKVAVRFMDSFLVRVRFGIPIRLYVKTVFSAEAANHKM